MISGTSPAFTATATVYGYYITTTEVSPKLLWVERAPSVYIMPSDGGTSAPGTSTRLTATACG